MKITKSRLRKIIKEMTISADEAEIYLRDRAASYKRDGLQGKGMRMLLQDDFMDDLGHQHNIEDYQWLIDELVAGEKSQPSFSQEVPHLTPRRKSSWQVRKEKELAKKKIGETVKITKNQLRKIVKEEKQKLQETMTRNEASIFSEDYIYDLLVDEVDLYLREDGPAGLTRTEQDMMRAALMGAFQSIVEDYGL